jgi:cytochrome c peroxidase
MHSEYRDVRTPRSVSSRAGRALAVASLFTAASALAQVPPAAGLSTAEDPSGVIGTVNVNGPMDRNGPFFQSLGSNGRSCGTCHLPSQAMSFTPQHAQRRFVATQGKDPLFASVDGANCSPARQSDPASHSLILSNGLIRIALAVPANAEFSLSVAHDPYGCALRIDPQTHVLTASVYRRPLPSTNLSFISAVMFDGRETQQPLSSAASFLANLRADLSQQAIDATTGHAQAALPPTPEQVQGIVDFELGLFTAQQRDEEAGSLSAAGAGGGPASLAMQNYYPGINDSLGQDPSGRPFTPANMSVYAAWENQPCTNMREDVCEARRLIAAGEKLFNSAPMTIRNVRGLNDNAALGRPESFQGNCATCHDAPNVGDHSLPLPLDIGTGHTADSSSEPDPLIAAAVGAFSELDLPVFLVSGCPNPFAPGEPASFYTTDPGRALITGHCSDLNRVKGPILRGLAARAPYFHNGAAANLQELVNFYNARFSMHLTALQKRQLVAFLNTL